MRCANPLCPARGCSLSDRDKNACRNILAYALALAAGVAPPAHMVRANRHNGGPAPKPFILLPSPLGSLKLVDVLQQLQSLGLLG